MSLTARQVPDKPCVDSTEEKVSRLGFFLCALNVIKNPLNLRCAEICVNKKSRSLLDVFFKTVLFKLLAVFRSSSALPNDSVINRLARMLVPYDSGLSLICNADTRNFLRVNSVFRARRSDTANHSLNNRKQNFVRVVLYPAVLRIVLGKLVLALGYAFAFLIKDNCTGACGSLVECHYKFFAHINSSFPLFTKYKILYPKLYFTIYSATFQLINIYKY